MPEFKLLIDRLTDKPQRFDFEADAGWWSARAALDEDRAEGRLERPFRFALDASRLGDGFLIEGTFEGGVCVECSRCTRRYAHALRDTFRLVLKPLKEVERGEGRGEGRGRESIDPEGERALAENGLCLGDDLEAGWFRGPVIFLDDFFAEIAALAMPIQPLCEEDCPGLCPHCGAARETAACGCEDERIESPFAVLARLKGEPGPSDAAEQDGKSGKSVKIKSARSTGSGRRR